MPPLRLAVDAIVEHGGAILVVEFEDTQFGRHFGLPGGGVEPDESLHEAVRREVWEETGAQVTVGSLLLVNEYKPETHAGLYGDQPEIRFVFHCHLCENSEMSTPSKPDEDQVATSWIPLEQLAHARLFPRIGELLFTILTTFSRYDTYNDKL